jgi:hypothetical protein
MVLQINEQIKLGISQLEIQVTTKQMHYLISKINLDKQLRVQCGHETTNQKDSYR